MPYVKWWHSLLIGLSVAGWSFSLPLYRFIDSNDSFQSVTAPTILVFMLIYQGLPVAAVFAVDRLIVVRWKDPSFYRALAVLAVIFVFLRDLQLNLSAAPMKWIDSLPAGSQDVVVVSILVAITGIVIYFRRVFTILVLTQAATVIVLTGIFATQVGLFGDAWRGDPVGRPAQTQPAAEVKDIFFLVVFDGLGGKVLLSGDRIDPDRFPNFAALGLDSAVFTDATSNYLSSHNSFRSLMTGTRFLDDDVRPGPLWAGSSGILGTLRDTGYRVEFFSNHFRCEELYFLCHDRGTAAAKNVNVVARDFAVWFMPRNISRFTRDIIVRGAPQAVTLRIPFDPIHLNSRGLWNDMLATISASDSPGKAYFIHSLLPHQPYEFDREGDRGGTISPEIGFDDFEQMANAYEQQVMFVDNLMGELLFKLTAEGLYDRSTIIVTGDHGPRSLGLGKQYSGFERSADYPDDLNDMVPRVPLIIHGPDIAPRVSHAEYQHIDLLPTVLDILDLPLRPDLRGVSAFSEGRPDREKVFHGVPKNRIPGEIVTYVYNPDTSRWHKAGLGVTAP